ncbi:tubulin epsilon chain isoform X1 [Diachasma alloeum]|uniref:tubulin epsilon chain isoform X1 n=1 Tax=Diachasma alloeum TaxID=454923 RepID=UPI0007384CA3|nr:tubulin epsilon chain isoform X1 [Diachasma alloeum]
MSQFVCVQVGQCGNQIGSAFWPLVLHEYGIETTSGGVNQLKIQKDYEKNVDDLSEAFNSFFHVAETSRKFSFSKLSDLTADGSVKARAILIDMEDSVVSRYRHGHLKNLFDETCTVTNYPGSGNNWAEGYYSHGRAYEKKIMETLRRNAERCDSLHGFLLMHSLGGGTGSGLGTATLKLLVDEYPHVERFVSCVYPAQNQDVVTAPYNVLLATRELIEYATCVFPADNGALFDICRWQERGRDNQDQARYNNTASPFQDINSVIVNMLLHLTSGARFPGHLNADMNDLATNLVPYPHLHYIFSSISPISMTASTIPLAQSNKNIDELFTNVWSRSHQLIKFDPLQPKAMIIGAAHIARGNCSMDDMRRNIKRFQTKVKFTPWSKETMKIGLCSVPPAAHPASLLCLINSSAMRFMFQSLITQFDKLYKKRAHVHHYLQVNGFEEENFLTSREFLSSVYDKYKQLDNEKQINIPRLKVL